VAGPETLTTIDFPVPTFASCSFQGAGDDLPDVSVRVGREYLDRLVV